MSRKVSPGWFSLLYLALVLLAASLVQKPLQREMSRLQQKRSSLRQMATLMQAEKWDVERLEKTVSGGGGVDPSELLPRHVSEGAAVIHDAESRSVSAGWGLQRRTIELTAVDWASLTGLLNELAAQSPSWQPYLVDLEVAEGQVSGRVGVESLDKVDTGN